MGFFFKCLAVFIGLTILLIIAHELLWDLPLGASLLLSAFASLLLTLLFGWIDGVYIQKRQPGLPKK